VETPGPTADVDIGGGSPTIAIMMFHRDVARRSLNGVSCPVRFPAFVAALLISLCAHPARCQDLPAGAEGYLSILQSAFSLIVAEYVDVVPPEVLFEGAARGMLAALGDPYSAFFSPAAARNVADIMAGGYGGLGITLVKQPTESIGYFEVESVVDGAPAQKAGLLPGDLVAAVDGEPTPPFSREELSSRLRGAPGSNVVLRVIRGAEGTRDIALVRELVEAKPVKRNLLPDGSGYLKIGDFSAATAERVEDALDYFRSENCGAIVIDLRDSPGGLFLAAVTVADLFLSEGPIVSVRSRDSSGDLSYSADSSISVDEAIPLIVIIGKGTASAAEILAGALRDNGRAILIGERSIGKGSVQRALLFDGSGIRITVSRFSTPSGANIEGIGLAVDREVSAEAGSGIDTALFEAMRLVASGDFRAPPARRGNPGGRPIAPYRSAESVDPDD
jgi:carboxyl-terminal processing protease